MICEATEIVKTLTYQRNKNSVYIAMKHMKIRRIQQEDNQVVAKIIREVLLEMGVPKVGTAYEDEALDMMYETYDTEKSAYFVVEDNGRIIGGAGIATLPGVDDKVCELQKMYFLPSARGQGLGSEIMNTCLNFAKEQGYKKCYLETMPYMEAATKLYTKTGFMTLDAPIGETGHYSCKTWMIKEL